jgi:hypothetical protein
MLRLGGRQVFGVVSHGLPPGTTGYQFILEQLLGKVPEEKIVLVGVGSTPWGGRARVPMPVMRFPARPSESAAAAIVLATLRPAVSAALARAYPVRRVLGTLDPTIGIAASWAHAARADLWIYGIDLHCTRFWNAGSFMRSTLERWRSAAFEQASRGFALTTELADWMRSRGLRAPIEILPPLYERWDRRPLPDGPPMLLYCGSLYSANSRPLKWVERAVSRLHSEARLGLVTLAPPHFMRRLGLHPEQWSIVRATPAEVPSLVQRCSWGIVALDPEYPEREALRVAWPTKLREYLSVGRPVLCVAAPDYAAARIIGGERWGVLAHDEESTQRAVAKVIATPRDELLRLGAAAHEFGLRVLDDRTIGAGWRERALSLTPC